ncbi:MAG TPA: TlpA disulfide reductase family protein [Opitutaceae bacterium]|nr:TlpA disulfide reductase family protein [Opitutaceae bacterium]
MTPRLLVLLALVPLLTAGCNPKKQPKPDVNVSGDAAMAAANEGTVHAAPVAIPADTASTTMAAGGTSGSLPVLGPAPAWKLKDLDGHTVSSDQFKGKVLVVDFWATWCPPCREEIPGYVDLYKKYGKDGLAIVGVSLDQTGVQGVKDFVTKYGVAYPVVMGDDAVVSAFGGMEAIPTTFLIDRDGRIRDKKVGAEPTDEYERKIKAILH